jgi:hypothetical protein
LHEYSYEDKDSYWFFGLDDRGFAGCNVLQEGGEIHQLTLGGTLGL